MGYTSIDSRDRTICVNPAIPAWLFYMNSWRWRGRDGLLYVFTPIGLYAFCEDCGFSYSHGEKWVKSPLARQYLH